MDSAFFFYDLTDVIPEKAYLATASNSRAIKDVNVSQSYSDKERLLIELIRKRNQIPFDYYKEIILNYRKIGDTLDMDKINQKIYNIMMREVF